MFDRIYVQDDAAACGPRTYNGLVNFTKSFVLFKFWFCESNVFCEPDERHLKVTGGKKEEEF